MSAERQIAEHQRPEANALQAHDPVPDVLAHALDLALAALVDRDLERVGLHAGDAGRRGHPVLELDAGAQRPQCLFADGGALDHRPVGLVDLEARVRQPVGEVAVVGQQDQPRRIGVEPPHRIEPLRCLHE
jgi:hypothetical protein